MKTIPKITLVLALFIACVSTNSFAQSPLAELQTMETTLNNDISAAQANISAVQAQLTTVASDIVTATDEGNEDDVAALTGRQNELNASLASLQGALTQLQADLASVQVKITAVQNELNAADKNWVINNTPPTQPATNNVTNVPNPNNPSELLMFFVPTGDSQLDEQIVHSWLLQRGLVDY